MAYTQTDLDAIDAAIASGVLTVRNGTRTITYQSFSDLVKARRLIYESLQDAEAGPARLSPRYRTAQFDDG